MTSHMRIWLEEILEGGTPTIPTLCGLRESLPSLHLTASFVEPGDPRGGLGRRNLGDEQRVLAREG